MNELIPFGKYKGQPIEVLQNDPQYVDWLLQQDWVKQRYPSVMNIIINNFNEPEETPEHNRLQIRFLDDEFRVKLATLILVPRVRWYLADAMINSGDGSWKLSGEMSSAGSPRFEEAAIDCQYAVSFHPGIIFKHSGHQSVIDLIGSHDRFRIEAKPSVGDDYPAILRQILATRRQKIDSNTDILVYENFQSSAINESQLKKFFESSGVKAISVAEIERSEKEFPSREKFISDFFARLAEEKFLFRGIAVKKESVDKFFSETGIMRPLSAQ